jgi:hypothetical protein
MDSRVVGLLVLGVGLVCLGAVGTVSGETQFDQSHTVQHSDGAHLADAEMTVENNTSDERADPNSAVVGPFDEPGVYEVTVTDVSAISVEVIGPGGGGGAEDTSDTGGVADGGDGGYIHAKFNVSEFSQIQITVGSGGGGGEPGSPGAGGDGYYDGADGGLQDTLIGGWHSSGGGGGGVTVVEGVHNGTTEPLAAAGGGGGGGAWDTYLTGSDNTGGGGGAAGGVGGTAEGDPIAGGGSDGNDAEQASGPIPNDIGGDGGNSQPNSVGSAGDGGTWVNNEFVDTIEEALPGGGGEGGSGASGTAEAGADGAVTLNPVIVIESLELPDTVTPEENLTVGYTLANTGNAAGTESFVDLMVNGTDAAFDDSDENVTVSPGELVNGTLTFDGVDEYFSAGDTIEFSVELWDFGDAESGAVSVESGADLVVDSLDYPTVIDPSEDLTVDYTVANVGTASGTESAVELSVAGTVEDTDTDVTVGSGGTADGTLTFTDVEESYGDGETVQFTVSLSDFGDSQSGATDVQDIGDGPALVVGNVDAPTSIPATGDLTVGYTIENAGDEAGTEGAVELLVDGAVEDTDTDVAVGAGETTGGTLTYENVDQAYAPGETVQFTVSLSDFGDSRDGETDLLADGEINLALEPSSAVVDPGTVKTYEVVVEGADSGILGYQGVVVDIGDTSAGNITGFDEQFDEGDGAFSASEVRNGGETLYLEAATGGSFTDPGGSLTIATFDVEAVGGAGAATDLSFDGNAPQTVAEFETGEPYTVDTYKNANLVLDAGDGPNLVLSDVQAPAEVNPSEDLTVNYTVENFGDESGTESAVELLVDGTTEATDTSVTVGAGEAADGSLTFDGVGGYEPGETVEWTVALADFGDSQSGQTQVPGPNLTITSLEYPDTVSISEDLAVNYTVENAGDAEGTESAVELLVDGTTEATDTDVTVGAGETASGSLVFSGVGDEFSPGETIEFTVELSDFGDTESGETGVEETSTAEFTVSIEGTNSPVTMGNDVSVTASVENTGDAEGTQSLGLSVGSLGTSSTSVTLAPGDSTTETLTVGTTQGDIGVYTAETTIDGDSDTATVEVVPDTGPPEFQVDSVETNAPLVEGETLELTVSVENIGSIAGIQTVTAEAVDMGQTSTEFSLDPGEFGQATMELDTDIGDTGEHVVVVETANHSMPETVELHLPVIPGYDETPRDSNGDELYEDIDGDGSFDIFDVQTLFNNLNHQAVQDHGWAYDFNNDDDVTIFDVQTMFNQL